MKRTIRCFLFLLAVAAAGCSTSQEAVSMRMMIPPFAEKHEINDRQEFMMAIPVKNDLPSFPGWGWVQGQVSTVCVEIEVSEEGDVNQARVIHTGDECDRAPPFEREAVKAVAGWEFFGAAICEFPEGAEKNAECRGEDVVVRPVPVKLSYAFTFFIDDEGKRGVRSQPMGR